MRLGAKGWEEVDEIENGLELVEEARRREVEHEILSYFLAVESYPARAAKQPQVSFEAHCWSVYTVLESGQANYGAAISLRTWIRRDFATRSR